jgi:hypothetical protein
MPNAEDNIRRLRQPEENLFDLYADEAEAERLGISLAEYRRGKEVGVWRKGEGERRPRNISSPAMSGAKGKPGLIRPTYRVGRISDRPEYKNDT